MRELLERELVKEFKLSEDQLEKLVAYAELLLSWTKKVDLIAPCSESELVERHLRDSLIANNLVQTEIKPGRERWLDIGSGAGIPGLVWAILNPDTEIGLVEPREKRTLFLSETKRRLKLRNLRVERSRLESLSIETRADLITCRALGSREAFLKNSLPLLNPGSFVVELLGSSVNETILATESSTAGYKGFKLLPYPNKSDSRQLAISNN